MIETSCKTNFSGVTEEQLDVLLSKYFEDSIDVKPSESDLSSGASSDVEIVEEPPRTETRRCEDV